MLKMFSLLQVIIHYSSQCHKHIYLFATIYLLFVRFLIIMVVIIMRIGFLLLLAVWSSRSIIQSLNEHSLITNGILELLFYRII